MALQESQTSSSDNNSITSSTTWVAQTWTTVSAYDITGIRLGLSRMGTFTGDVTVAIKATDGSGKPTGADLTSFTFDGSTLTTNSSGEWATRNFDSPYSLSSGVIYAIVIRHNGIGYQNLRYRRTSTSVYAGGAIHVSSDSGSSWGSAISQDAKFAIYGDVAVPSKPTNPTPTNSATGVDFSGLVLDWDDGGGADTFDVFMGPSGSLVEIASVIVPSTYTVDLSDVPTDQVIYWRVDATNSSGTTTGDTWNFDARPVKAITPSPTDAASSITLDETPLSWIDGGNSDTYEIYFREQGDSWGLVGVAQAGLTWAITFGTLAYGTTYEWRIDATNTYGTTTGDTWSFDTISYNQIRVSFRLISGGNGNGPYSSPPGVQGVDWEYTGESNMLTVKRLVAAANSTIWYESI